jgi:putative phosphoesterase
MIVTRTMCGSRFVKRESDLLSEANVLARQRRFSAPLMIGVISDTHIYPGGRRQLPGEIPDLFNRFACGLIVHAGDCNTISTLRQLAGIAPVLAVVGNNDDAGMREIAPRELTFTVSNTKVALLHGDGGVSARSEAKSHFGGRADLVIYGHSHIPMIETIDETTYFNPGSPTDRRWHEYFGLGVIRIAESGVRPELILFKHPQELTNVKPD